MPSEAEFTSPKGKDELLFRSLQAREELGRLPEYRLQLLRDTKKGRVLPKELLGLKAGLKITLHDGSFREINGLVTSFEAGGISGDFDVYHVELRPWLWHLTLGADCRVFQDKTVLEILDEVFADYGSSTRLDKRTSATYASRPYTVQYRETDFDFVSRLMEEEGIYYFFKYESGQHTMVLCDSAKAHQPMKGDPLEFAAKLKDGDDLAFRNNFITHWWRAHTLRSVSYAHTDFAAEAPATDLFATKDWEAPYTPKDFEVFDYPGGQDDHVMGTNTGTKKKEGERTAKLHAEIFQSGYDVSAGVTEYRQLAVGSTFTFKKHADAGDFLVTSSIFEMEFAGYESNDDNASTSYSCRFDAVPKATPFQPERVMQQPIVNGPQTATVVGPSGDEIHTDKYGRVKVQFHWDRVAKKKNLLEKSSCWVRVSFPWASKQFGMVALPRIGDEVVVDFLEGNPDRPLVTGRVYNGTNMPPWELPAQATVSGIKTKSSKGGGTDNFNELRFDDKKGSEYVWLQAEKDFHRLVKNDDFDTVKNDRHALVEKNSSLHIKENFDAKVDKKVTLKAGEDVHADLGADLLLKITGALGLANTGEISLKGDQAIALSSGMGMDVKIGMAGKISAETTLHLKANMGVVIDGGMQLTIKAGAGSVVLGPDGVSITGPLVKINSGGSPGAAEAAKKAAPPSPQAPKDPKENKDPLAS
jgi:type VI secretion system secreted protein VgrG